MRREMKVLFLVMVFIIFSVGVSMAQQTFHLVVGYYTDAAQKQHGFWYNDSSRTFTRYDVPGSGGTQINKINDLGYMVGKYVVGTVSHGFLYHLGRNTLTTIDFPGATATNIHGINNRNKMVGRYRDTAGGWHGFVYSGQDFTVIDYPGAVETYCSDIDEAGNMVGFYKKTTGMLLGFYYDGSTFTSIEYQGAKYVKAWDINGENRVAGNLMDKKEKIRGFLYDGIDMTFVDYPLAYHTYCGGLNDENIVVGGYTDADTDWRYGFTYAGATFTTFVYPASTAMIVYGITAPCRDFSPIESYTVLHANGDDPRIVNTDGRLLGGYYPSIIYDPVKDKQKPYRMWFSSPGSPVTIKFSQSQEGEVWDIPQGVTGLQNPHHVQVVYISDQDKYRVYYWDTAQLYSIAAMRTAQSTDGIGWTDDTVISQPAGYELITGIFPDFNRGSYGPVAVFYNRFPTASVTGSLSQDPHQYRFAYYYDCTTGGQQVVSLAVSDNGTTFYQWHLLQGNSPAQPVMALGNPADWDSNYATHGAIFRSNEEANKWYFYYSGGRNAVHEGIGMAYSTDHGVTWTKYGQNPVRSMNDGIWWHSRRCYSPAVIYGENGKCLGADRLYKIWITGDDGSFRGLGYLYLE